MVRIEPCRPEQLDTLIALAKKTFADTYSGKNSPESIQEYLDQNFTADQILPQFSKPSILYFLVFLENEMVGYLKLNYLETQTDVHDPEGLEIERIYVLKDYHGKGLGKLMVEKAKEIALESGLKFIWLGVWRENHQAILFYEKMGFKIAGKHLFYFAGEMQEDFLMRLDLKN